MIDSFLIDFIYLKVLIKLKKRGCKRSFIACKPKCAAYFIISVVLSLVHFAGNLVGATINEEKINNILTILDGFDHIGLHGVEKLS